MKYKIITTLDFLRDLKRLSKRYRTIKDDVNRLGEELLAHPNMGVDLGDGIRKVRLAIGSKGRGKSGGARVITYNVITCMEEGHLLLVTIYDKAEQSSITKREIVARLKKAGIL